jgi:hypothetical protein
MFVLQSIRFKLLSETRKIADISQQQNERIESKQREKMYKIRSLPKLTLQMFHDATSI